MAQNRPYQSLKYASIKHAYFPVKKASRRFVLFQVTLSDRNYSKPRLSTFYIAFHIFVVGGNREFKIWYAG